MTQPIKHFNALQLVLLISTTVTCLSSSGQTVIDYPNGFSGVTNSAIHLGTYSSVAGSQIHLVSSTSHNADNAWYTTPVNIQAFTTTFTFHADCSHAPSGGCGNGMGFQFINNSTQPDHPSYYSGFSGGQFSYSQCSSPLGSGVGGSSGCPVYPNALVKFDMCGPAGPTGCGAGLPGGNYTGYYMNGEYPEPPNANYNMAAAGINMQSGHTMRVTLTYNGSTLAETVADTSTGATYTNSYNDVNLPQVIGSSEATVGFSGGTGAALADIYIDSWTYTASTSGETPAPPTPTPPPAPADPSSGQTVIDYPNGFSGVTNSAIHLGTYSSVAGSQIHLVSSTSHNADNAWYTTPVNIQAFTTTFTFHADCSHAPSGGCGNGMGFQFINNSTQPDHPSYYSGFSGGQFSYSQCSSPLGSGVGGSSGCPVYPNALVKFDMCGPAGPTGCGAGLPGGNYTGYYMNGEYPEPPNANYNMAAAGINMQSGHTMRVTLTYNGSTLAETVADTSTGATYTNSYYDVNLPQVIGSSEATVGFSGGTGAALADIYIDSWTYTVN